MSITFDTTEVERTLNTMRQNTGVAVEFMLVAGQRMVLADAVPRTPVDTGLLVKSYETPPPVAGFAVVMNTCPYAVFVHERKATHLVGQDHFLMEAVNNVLPEFYALVAGSWLKKVL